MKTSPKRNALPLHGQTTDLHPRHPLGSKARVLLSSAYGPFAVDSDVSRAANPMELYHNQVTREQRGFSLRMHHRSFGLMLIQENLDAPCTLLDFPTLGRFRDELLRERYDVIGIGAIIPNFEKVRRMCALAREIQPQAILVVGGHVANVPSAQTVLGADYVVRGEGVAWMRRFLGEDAGRPIRHPAVLSGLGARTMGVALGHKPGDTAAMVMTGVGCPMGCNFCATSAMFGGKGSVIHFYESGDELFEVMCELEQKLDTRSFFLMDENFLLYRKRALRLLELMEQHDKPWSLYLFSSAHVLSKYSMDQIVRLGVSWVWMGLEGEAASYDKLKDIDTYAVVRELQSHGVRVLGSSIIGLEEHSAENIERVIDYAARYDTDFHQFMLYTPIPGTPLYRQHEDAGDLLSTDEVPLMDMHGQARFNFRHRHIHAGQEGQLLRRAFERDFERNGPSVLRIARTTLAGYQRHKSHESARVRARVAAEAKDLSVMYAGALWAASRHYAKTNAVVAAKMRAVLGDIVREHGLKSRLLAPLVGRYLLKTLAREEAHRQNDDSNEPPTFYEHNDAARVLSSTMAVEPDAGRGVEAAIPRAAA